MKNGRTGPRTARDSVAKRRPSSEKQPDGFPAWSRSTVMICYLGVASFWKYDHISNLEDNNMEPDGACHHCR
jgi:hypothetical protein